MNKIIFILDPPIKSGDDEEKGSADQEVTKEEIPPNREMTREEISSIRRG